MEVIFMGTIQKGMDVQSIHIPSESKTTVEQVLRKIAMKYPVLRERMEHAGQDDLSDYMLMTVNGKIVDLTTSICEEDVLKVFQPIVGG